VLAGKEEEIAGLRREKEEQGGALAASEGKLAAKDGKIEFLRHAVLRHTGMLRHLVRNEEQQEAALAASKAAVAVRDGEIARLSRAGEQQETARAANAAALAAKEDELFRTRREQETELAAKDAALLRAGQEKKRQLNTSDERAARLRREQEQESTLQLAAKDGAITRLGEQHDAALAGKEAERQLSQDELCRVRQEHTRLLQAKEAEIAGLLHAKEQGRGLEALGKRRRDEAEASAQVAYEIEERFVKVKLEVLETTVKLVHAVQRHAVDAATIHRTAEQAKKLRETLREVVDDTECIICTERFADHALPCGHRLCFSAGCPSVGVDKCPICQGPAQPRTKLFGVSSLGGLKTVLSSLDVSLLYPACLAHKEPPPPIEPQ